MIFVLKKYPTIIIFLSFNMLISCRNDLDEALFMAGKNRPELEKVLNHYKHDQNPLKYKAAIFLITNMRNKYYLWSDDFEKYQKYIIDSMKKFDTKPLVSKFLKVNRIQRYSYFENLMDRYENKITRIKNIRFKKYYDLENISSKFLIENIDYSFKAWQFPWAQRFNFEKFCEFILPYRYGTEKPESWRPFFMNYFKNVTDSAIDSQNPVELCRKINKILQNQPFFISDKFEKGAGSFSPRYLFYVKEPESCIDMCGLAIIAMRANGIPVTELSIPFWGNALYGHNFNAVLDSSDHWESFMGAEKSPGEHKVTDMENRVPSKIFLKKFSISSKNEGPIIEDVTSEFIPTIDLKFKIEHTWMNSKKWVMINIFNNKNWRTLSATRNINDSIIFCHMGLKVVYLITSLSSIGKEYPLTYPVKVDSIGNIKLLKPNKKFLITLRMSRRKFLEPSYINSTKFLVGGKFQISKDLTFNNSVTIYLIKNQTAPFEQYVNVLPQKTRFIRFLFPSIKEPIAESLANIAFYRQKKSGPEKIMGKYIFSEGVNEDQIRNLFISEHPLSIVQYEHGLRLNKEYVLNKAKRDSFWIGIMLNQPDSIIAVSYKPRTDHFYIYPGKRYELFYWDNHWVSLGQQTAITNYLVYNCVPSGSLYWLIEVGGKGLEGVFTYENEKQIW